MLVHVLAERLGKSLSEVESWDADELTRWRAFDEVMERHRKERATQSET